MWKSADLQNVVLAFKTVSLLRSISVFLKCVPEVQVFFTSDCVLQYNFSSQILVIIKGI